MLKVAITGLIASGKSHLANLIEQQAYPVFYSDKFVAKLYEQQEFVFKIIELLPNLKNYQKYYIAEHIFNNSADRIRLEKLIHPLVKKALGEFFTKWQYSGCKFCFAEIPLLFETNMDKMFDYTINVSCSDELRLKRALQRPTLTVEKFYKITGTQLPDKSKILLADYVLLSTDNELDLTTQITELFKKLNEHARNNI